MTENLLSQIKEFPKMVSIDVGTDSTKFLLLRNQGDRYTFQYEILEENLYELKDTSKRLAVEKKIREIVEVFNLHKKEPVYLSFSKEIEIERDEKKVTEEIKKKFLVLPLFVRQALASSDISQIFFLEANQYVMDILEIMSHCNITVDSFCLSPVALTRASHASVSEDEFYDVISILDFGAQQTICSVSAGNMILDVQKFNFGGNQLLEILSSDEKMKKPRQEDLEEYLKKIQEGKIKEATGKWLSEIKDYFAGLVRERKIYPVKVLLSGGIVRLPKMPSYISEYLKIPSQIWGIRGRVSLKHSLLGKKKFIYDEPALAVSLGMLSKDVIMVKNGLFFKILKRFFSKNGRNNKKTKTESLAQ